MIGQRGSSVVELLVASAVLMTVCAATLGLLHDALAATPVLEETGDLHQRARVAADALSAELRAASAGTGARALTRYLAAIEPRAPGDLPGAASDRVLTVRYTTPRGAHGRLAQPLNPGGMVIALAAAGCPDGATACGFTTGSHAVILDDAGWAAFVRIEATGPGTLVISDPRGPRAGVFPAGAAIAEAVEVTYTFDPAARQVRRSEGGGAFIAVDNVVEARFEYFDDNAIPLALAAFRDGPFQGRGALAFDTDLGRVRAVRASLRLETGVDAMRGRDARLFARPGTATGRVNIPDLPWSVHVTLRNGS